MRAGRFVDLGEGEGESNWYEGQLGGLSSVSLAADSSLCGGSLLGEAVSAEAAVEYPQSCALRMTASSAEGVKGARLWTRGCRLRGGEAVDGARLAAFRSPPPPLRVSTY